MQPTRIWLFGGVAPARPSTVLVTSEGSASRPRLVAEALCRNCRRDTQLRDPLGGDDGFMVREFNLVKGDSGLLQQALEVSDAVLRLRHGAALDGEDNVARAPPADVDHAAPVNDAFATGTTHRGACDLTAFGI